jgi:hypothetical protein
VGLAVAILLVLLVAAVGAKRSVLPAVDGDRPAPAERPRGADTEKWVPLFNGKDLTGWHTDGGNPGQWSAEGDTIVGRSPFPRTRSYLLTDKEYADFVLRFEFQVEAAGQHGGVAIRAVGGEKVPFNDKLFLDHPMVKLVGPRQNSPEVTGTTSWVKSGDVYVPPVEDARPSAGTWHALEVTVRGETCTAVLAGRQIVNVTLDRGRPTNAAFLPALQRGKGKVGFQINTGTLRFRKIEIKQLLAAGT